MCNKYGPRNHKEVAKARQKSNHREEGLPKHSLAVRTVDPDTCTSAHDALLRCIGSMMRAQITATMPATGYASVDLV